MSRFSIAAIKERANNNPAAFHLTAALAATVLLFFIPFADAALYPLRLLVTFFHEAAHALAGVLTLGTVTGMTVNPDTSGLTTVHGGIGFLISTAGYIGTTLLGALLILLSRKDGRVRPTLIALGAATMLLAVLFGGSGKTWPALLAIAIGLGLGWKAWGGKNLVEARDDSKAVNTMKIVSGLMVLGAGIYLAISGALLTWLVGLGCGAALLWAGLRAPQHWARFGLAFLAVQTTFNALGDLKTLLGLSVYSNVHTDAQNMASSTGIPATVWALMWGALSLVIVGFALWRFYRHPANESQPANETAKA